MTVSREGSQLVAVGTDPFTRLSAILLVALGTLLFVTLLWMIGSGMGAGSANNGGAHAGGKGLSGYAAFADYLERRGYQVRRSRNKGALSAPGLVVLTPPSYADGSELDRIVAARRTRGPTLVIVPKWVESIPGRNEDNVPRGWVRLEDVEPAHWPGFLDEISLRDGEPVTKGRARWQAVGVSGALPDGRHFLAGAGTGLVRLVRGPSETDTLAGFLDDGGSYPGLEAMAMDRVLHSGEKQDGRYPVIMVFEPDLLDNWGMAQLANAILAEKLVRASGVEPGGQVGFDLTFNGLGQSDNLLTLAFRPPYLAATLCLLMAALVIGWRAFLRFGPALGGGPAIAFGKRALIANAAGLIRRSGRLHLIARPYVERARRRLAAALALPREIDATAADAAIDRAQVSRRIEGEPFSAVVARLVAARTPPDLLRNARELHALERRLTQGC